MKKIFIALLFFALTPIYASAKKCTVADTMINTAERYFLANDVISLNFKNHSLRKSNFTTTSLANLEEGDFAFRVAHSYGENGREKIGLGRCVFTGILTVVTLGNSDLECKVPDEVLEITSVQLLQIERKSGEDFEYQVVDEFQVETEWYGPQLPNFHKNIASKSKKQLQHCSSY